MFSPFSAPIHALSYLHERGISASIAEEAKYRHRPADAIKRALWGPDDETHGVPGDGLEIPYLDLTGQPLLGLDGLPFCRYRIFDTRTEKVLGDKKAVRYMSAPGAGYRPYLPAGLSRLLDSGPAVLVITEGEIKAQSAVAHGIACVGIGGVTLWMHPEARVHGDEITHDSVVHPEIAQIAAQVGRVVVLVDSDAKKNDAVREAMQLFAEALRKQVPTAVVAYARCKDPERRGAKQGLDDWIQSEGAPGVEKFILWHLRTEEKRVKARRNSGFEPLGYTADGFAAWSVAKGTIEQMGKGDLTNSSKLISLCGYDWCEAEFGKVSDSGVGVDWTRLGGHLAATCVAKGPFDAENVRGPGVWAHSSDQNVLIVNSVDIWRTDGCPIERVTGDLVYPRYRDLGVAFDTTPATMADTVDVLAALQTWQWSRPSDALLLLGWIGLGYVAGALHWRPHMSLTGPRGTGKSTLMSLMGSLLGKAAIKGGGATSEAGIRQAIGNAAPALLLDEGEADGAHLAKVLEFLRSASSGDRILKGTADHGGRQFTVRALGCIAGIRPPAMGGADASRFMRLTLKKPLAAAVAQPHPLLDLYSGAAQEMGPRLFSRTLALWPRYLRAVPLVNKQMRLVAAGAGADARAFDTLTPAVAMSLCLVDDAEITVETAQQFVAGIDLAADFERIAEASDEDDLWGLLVTRAVQTSAGGASQKTTIGTLIESSAKEKCRGPWSTELGTYGMKLIGLGGRRYELRVNTKAREFAALFADTAYARADLVEALRRHPTAEPKSMKTDRIGGGNAVRYVALTLEISTPTLSGPVCPSNLD